MVISSCFDSGNIEIDRIEDHNQIYLNIRKDIKAEFFQWFYFRVQECRDIHLNIHLQNASKSSYPEAWDGYEACASYDRKHWFRVNTYYNGKELLIKHKPVHNTIFFAYFAPFTYEQHLNMVTNAQLSEDCHHFFLAKTVEGRDIDLLKIGEHSIIKKKIWIVARQHAGESMASYFVKGFLKKILDKDDPVSKKLKRKARFYIVPNMNIDGSIAGNLRANANGLDLNRQWENPDKEKCPEVYFVKKQMIADGVDMFLDIHGDETLPYNFISSIEGIPSFNKRLQKELNLFKDCWRSTTPDFQDMYKYPVNEPGKANLAIGSKQIGELFKCLSMTVEMPFKDNNDLPDPISGWSPRRSQIFGASLVNTLLCYLEKLK